VTLRQRLSELLKGYKVDIEGKLVSFAYRRRGGINVKQKGEFNLVLVHPDAVDVLTKEGSPSDLVGREKEELRGLTRNDLAGQDAITFEALFDDRQLLKSMSRILNQDDLSALISAIRLKRFEEAGQAAKAFELRNELRRQYKIRGNRIQVFYSTGLMQEFMGPVLAMVEFTPTITEINRARDIFNRCIDYMENAVYVNNLYTPERVADEIRTRFEIDNAKVVLVLGLGQGVVTHVKAGVAEFLEPEKERQVSLPLYKHEFLFFDTKIKPGVIVTITKTR
jgi:hypothetical protein